jgi:hypothetical protein
VLLLEQDIFCDDIVLEECVNNVRLCACGSHHCPPAPTTPDAVVIDGIEEFDDEEEEGDHDGIKEFNYDNAMEDNQLISLPSAVFRLQEECHYVLKETLL